MTTSSSSELVSQIQQARFTPVRLGEGYDMGEVDQLLDEVVAALQQGRPVAPLIDAARFTTTRWREGYEMSDVDGLLARVRAEDPAGSAVPSAAPAGAPAARQVQVTVDCADPRSLSLFWNAVLGYRLPPPPPGFDDWDAFAASLPPELRNSASASEDPAGVGPRLFFQRVPEGKVAKNRFHLDVRAAPGLEGAERMLALEAEATRLITLGASRVERHEPAPPMAAGHLVMRDPEGNEFCLD